MLDVAVCLRVARLVAEGLVCRAAAKADGRGVVVVLTEAGVTRLTETAPVHLGEVYRLFVARLRETLSSRQQWWSIAESNR